MICARQVGSVLVPLFAAGCLAFSCSFPDVGFAPESSNDADGSDALPPDVDPDGKNKEAATRDDSSVRIDAGPDAIAGCAALGLDPCDCDSDKARNGGPGCSPPNGARADCDDFDALVGPEQDFVASVWDPASPHKPDYDWNCDGEVTKQFPYNVNCAIGTDCSEGFATDVPCGTRGTYNTCQVGLDVLGIKTCSVARTDMRTQGCR